MPLSPVCPVTDPVLVLLSYIRTIFLCAWLTGGSISLPSTGNYTPNYRKWQLCTFQTLETTYQTTVHGNMFLQTLVIIYQSTRGGSMFLPKIGNYLPEH
jgi:hypothetical protein